MNPRRTKTLCVRGRQLAAFMSLWLTDKSQWFEVEPLPDDVFEFHVKEEFLRIAHRTASIAADMTWAELEDEFHSLIELQADSVRCDACQDLPGKDGLGRPCKKCHGAGRIPKEKAAAK